MKKTLLSLAVAAALLTGCGEKTATSTIPEVTDANCQPKPVLKMSDKQAQEEFAVLCSKRGIGQKTEKPMNWLELEPKPESKP